MPDLVRVQIDLNMLDDQGLTRARVSNATGEIEVDDVVEVFEPEDGVKAPAVVVDVRGDFVLLRVDWDALDDDDVVEGWPTAVLMSQDLWQLPSLLTTRGVAPAQRVANSAPVREPEPA